MKTHQVAPSVSYSFTARLTYPNRIAMFARVAQTIGQHGGDLGAVDIVASDSKSMTRDITVRPRDEAHQEEIVAALRELPGVKVVHVSDRVFLLHLGGKIAIQNKVPRESARALQAELAPQILPRSFRFPALATHRWDGQSWAFERQWPFRG